MYIVDGYKMAEGTATVRFLERESQVEGVFLYRPDTDLWYMAPTPEYPWGTSFSRKELIKIEQKEGGTVWTSSHS